MKKSVLIKLGTWNVRTMTTGIDITNLNKTDHLRMTALMDRELTRLHVDIAALQETRLANSGLIREL